VTVLHGDCVDLMRGMPDCSVDAIVTDPPYELGFMGKQWDGAGIAYSLEMWGEALRVLKPGGHLLAFGGTRTYHRMACAIEDAGFEIRDSIHWVYGSGFPKSLNIGKAIDKRRDERHEEALTVTVPMAEAMKAKGLTRRDLNAAVGREPNDAGSAQSWTTVVAGGAHKPRVPTLEQWIVLRSLLALEHLDSEVWRLNGRKGQPGEAWHEREVVGTSNGVSRPGFAGETYGPDGNLPVEVAVTVAATDEARRWEGWGTALKPAHEPIVVARKPLVGTVAGNVLVWGTGGLNIDGCRVASGDTIPRVTGAGTLGGSSDGWDRPWKSDPDALARRQDRADAAIEKANTLGRWPANVVFDRTAGEALDQQSGVSKSQGGRIGKKEHGSVAIGGAGTYEKGDPGFGDTGGASRFFTQADYGPDDWPFVYQAKPSRKERNAGLDGMPEQRPNQRTTTGMGTFEEKGVAKQSNHHPTVKPVALMRHLVRLVTPPGGTVLDPFAGSGTTLVAAVLEGFDVIGCEMTDEYLPIIEGRMAWARDQVNARAAEPEQTTLL
jgi:DNA modification methylase